MRDFSGGGNGSLRTVITSVTGGFTSGINTAIASLGKFSGAVGIAGAAVALLGGVQLKKATDAAQRFEDNMIRLNKVAGSEWGRPLARGIRELSRDLPVASQQLFDVAESAVRLGITGQKNIQDFVETMAMVGQVTDMSAVDASENFARIAAVMDVPISKIRHLASAANEMSDQMATSFSEVVRSTGEMAPVLTQMGVEPDEILAFAAAQNEVNVSVQRGAQRLRSWAQQLNETNRAANIAGPLNMTTEAFMKLVESSPVEALVLVAKTMREGGDAARGLREAFDSAGRLGVQALSQNIDSLNKAFDIANRQFQEGDSLVRQFGEQVDGATARQQLMRNEIEATRAEIGENLLPLKKGWFNFWGGAASLISETLGALNPLREAMRLVPDEMVEATQKVFREARKAEIRASDAFQQSFSSMELSKAISGIGRFSEEETVKFAQRFSELAAEMETTEQRGRLMHIWLQTILPAIDGVNMSIEDGKALLAEYSEAILVGSASWKEYLESLDEDGSGGGGTDGLTERLKGLNIEFARQELAKRYGVALSEVSDEVAHMMLSLAEAEIGFSQGDEAARRWRMTLEGVPKHIQDIIVMRERQMRIEESYKDVVDELTQAQRELTMSDRQMFVERVKSMEGLTQIQKTWLIAAWDRNEAIEDEQKKQEELDKIVEDLTSQKNELLFTERELFLMQVRKLTKDEEEIQSLEELYDSYVRLREEREKQEEHAKEQERRIERINRLIERVDINSIDNRFKMLNDTLDMATDNIFNLFDSIRDQNKKFTEEFIDSIRMIAREMLSMMIKTRMLNFLKGQDFFMDLMGIGAGASGAYNAGAAGMGSGGGGGGGFDASSGMSAQQQPVNMNLTFEIKAIDSRDASQFFEENSPKIASNIAREFQRNSNLQRAASGR